MTWNTAIAAVAAVLVLHSSTLGATSRPGPQDDAPFELERLMGDPDWIARSPSEPRWSPDGERVRFARKRPNSALFELFEIELPTATIRPVPVEEATLAELSGGSPDASGRRVVFARRGNLFLHEDGAEPRILARWGSTDVSDPIFLASGEAVAYRRGDAWFVCDLESGVESEIARLVVARDPEDVRREADEERSHLARAEERLFAHVADERRAAAEHREAERERRERDPHARVAIVHLGERVEIRASALSPDGRTLAVRLAPAGGDDPPRDLLPTWIGESGYVTAAAVRPTVGTRGPAPERLVLIDLESRRRVDVEFPVGVRSTDGAPSQWRLRRWSWSPRGDRLAVVADALDFRTRSIVAVTPAGEVTPVHELRDDAWINHGFAELGWLPGGRTLWYTSEASGFAHLYLHDVEDGERRQLTAGEHENDEVVVDRAGRALWWRSTAGDLAAQEVHYLPLDRPDAEPRRATSFGGQLEFAPCPRGERLLVTVSYALVPPELYVVDVRTGEAVRLTHTVEPGFAELPWIEPSIVHVPGRDGRSIPARLFMPPAERAYASGERPAVVFVHGAGYLQQAHRGWSYYFRETLFHTLLARRGAVVLEPDYRASAGYGRDWRVAIHGRMGEPEIEDLEDCVAWLTSEHGVDPARVAVYGGSYGGFLTLQAMFQRPALFACGAALRPVTDWAHYSHGYTAPILGTPEANPDAFRRSSPIEHAAGLERPLLVTHGLVDDNVLPKDSIRLVQRLIELGKRDFEFALYPVEPHGFRSPASWLDQYRRILGLFERHLPLPAR